MAIPKSFLIGDAAARKGPTDTHAAEFKVPEGATIECVMVRYVLHDGTPGHERCQDGIVWFGPDSGHDSLERIQVLIVKTIDDRRVAAAMLEPVVGVH